MRCGRRGRRSFFNGAIGTVVTRRLHQTQRWRRCSRRTAIRAFAPFAKLQPYGHGRWPNGTMANHVPHHRTSDEVWVRPGGKCAAGMWVSKNEETPDAASLPSGIARPARAELS